MRRHEPFSTFHQQVIALGPLVYVKYKNVSPSFHGLPLLFYTLLLEGILKKGEEKGETSSRV